MSSRPGGSLRIPNIRVTPTLIGIVLFVLAALAVLGGMFVFGLYLIFVTTSPAILPGVRVGNTELGGLNIQQASEELDRQWNGQHPLVLVDGDRHWFLQPSELGLHLEAQSTAAMAYQVGRGSEGLSQALSLLLGGGWNVAPLVSFQPEIAAQGLGNIALSANIQAVDATLKYEQGSWQALPGIAGKALDVESAILEIGSAPELVLTTQFFALPMASVAPRASDVSASLEKLKPTLETLFNFQAYDPILNEWISWTVGAAEFAPWLRIVEENGEPQVLIDQPSLADYLARWQTSLGDGRTVQTDALDTQQIASAWKAAERITLILRHPSTTYVIQPGDMLTGIAYSVQMPYWKILEANPDLDMNTLPVGQTITIPSPNDMLSLPVVPNKRIVISIAEQRMWDLSGWRIAE